MKTWKHGVWKNRWRFPFSLCFCFLMGSVVGSVVTNLLGRELLMQIGSFDLWYEVHTDFRQNLKKRLGQFFVGSLGGMTSFSGAWFSLLFLIMGAGMGVWITALTLYGGWRGILLFLAKILPHWLLYGSLWLFLAAGGETGLDHMKLRGWIFLVLWLAAGILTESRIAPLATDAAKRLLILGKMGDY